MERNFLKQRKEDCLIDYSLHIKVKDVGYSHYIGGKIVSSPHEDKAEDFYEVDLSVVDEDFKFD